MANTRSEENYFAEHLRRELARRDWSAKKLAAEMGKPEIGCSVPHTAVYRMIDKVDSRRVNVNELAAIAQVFGMDPMDLIQEPDGHFEEAMMRAEQEAGQGAVEIISGMHKWFNAHVDAYEIGRRDPTQIQDRTDADGHFSLWSGREFEAEWDRISSDLDEELLDGADKELANLLREVQTMAFWKVREKFPPESGPKARAARKFFADMLSNLGESKGEADE